MLPKAVCYKGGNELPKGYACVPEASDNSGRRVVAGQVKSNPNHADIRKGKL
jgi:hypothetical protein